MKITIDNLSTDSIVKYRTGIAGRYNVVWIDWKTGPVYVVRRSVVLKRKPHCKNYEANAIITLTTKNDLTAHYSIDDCVEENSNIYTFNCEEYYLELDLT